MSESVLKGNVIPKQVQLLRRDAVTKKPQEVIILYYNEDGTLNRRESSTDPNDLKKANHVDIIVPVTASFTIYNGETMYFPGQVAFVTPSQAKRVVNSGGNVLSKETALLEAQKSSDKYSAEELLLLEKWSNSDITF